MVPYPPAGKTCPLAALVFVRRFPLSPTDRKLLLRTTDREREGGRGRAAHRKLNDNRYRYGSFPGHLKRKACAAHVQRGVKSV